MVSDFMKFVFKNEDLDSSRLSRDIKKSNNTWGIQQMYTMYQEGRLDFDFESQRPEGRWNADKQCLLVDSIMRGYPIPQIFIMFGPNGAYIVLDGKQRLVTTVFRFRNNEFHLVGLEPIPFMVLDDKKKPTGEIVYYDVNGKTYDELPEKLKQAFNEYELDICCLDSGNGIPVTNDIIRSVFRRLNNGVALSRKELNIASCTDLTNLTELGQHELFQTILSDKAKAARNQITILMKMYLMLHKDLDEVSFGPDDMTEAMEDTITTEEDRKELTAILDKMLDVFNLFGDEDKTNKAIRKRWTTETHMVSLAPWFKKAINEEIPDEMLMEFLAEAFADKMPISPSYAAFSRSGSGRTHAIVGRDAEIARLWAEFFDIAVDFGEEIEEDEEDEIEEEEAEVVEVEEPKTEAEEETVEAEVETEVEAEVKSDEVVESTTTETSDDKPSEEETSNEEDEDEYLFA